MLKKLLTQLSKHNRLVDACIITGLTASALYWHQDGAKCYARHFVKTFEEYNQEDYRQAQKLDRKTGTTKATDALQKRCIEELDQEHRAMWDT